MKSTETDDFQMIHVAIERELYQMSAFADYMGITISDAFDSVFIKHKYDDYIAFQHGFDLRTREFI